MNSFYEIVKRDLGLTKAISVIAKRGSVEAQGAEKIVPLIIEFNKEGEFKLINSEDVLAQKKECPYKPNSASFNAERLADVEIFNLSKVLEHFPTLNTYTEGKIKIAHPVAETIYKYMFYLSPNEELIAEMDKLNFLAGGELFATALEEMSNKFTAITGKELDLHAVPKGKWVGRLAFLADEEGYGLAPKKFAFGFHKCIPADRFARELSQIKGAERFINSAVLPFKIDEELKPFITMLRVAVVCPEQDMLDSGDLYPSSVPKLACNLISRKIVKDFRTIPNEERNLELSIVRAGIEVVHVEEERLDEINHGFSALKLVFPAGVKIVAQMQKSQCYDMLNVPVDIMVDYRSIARKGAIALLAMMNHKNFERELTRTECLQELAKLKKESVRVGNTEYPAYIGYIPVFRTNHRYTSYAKPSNKIAVDFVAKAKLSLPYKVPFSLERTYVELKNWNKEINKIRGKMVENGI